MATAERAPIASRSPGPAEAVPLLRAELRTANSVSRKLCLLAAAHDAQPWIELALDRELERIGEGEFMFDDFLKLLKAWHLHRHGRQGERDYYLHAFQREEDRQQIRQALGIRPQSALRRLVILITVDCLRGDSLSCNGHGRPTTPAIDALAAAGVSFPRAYSTAGQTAQSFPGIMLSNFFQNFGCSRVVPDGLVTLAEVMSGEGFRTAAVNAANPHVSHFYGYDRGFDEFRDYLGPENFRHEEETFSDNSPRRLSAPSEQELAGVFEDCNAHPDVYAVLRDLTGLEGMPLVRQMAARERFYPYHAADIVKDALDALYRQTDASSQFLWLHLMDLHESITVPYSPLGQFSPVQRFLLNTLLALPVGLHVLRAQAEKYRELYDAAVSYVDLNVQVLGNFLRDSGLWERTLLCVTADHGQELLEGGVFGHGHDRLAEGVVHVPLVLSGGLAGRVDGRQSDREVSLLDLAPTILDVCGITPKPEAFLGMTLNDTRPRVVYGQTFYGDADNLCPRGKGRRFDLKPLPAPVKDCCKEMFYCIEGGWQVIHDVSPGRTEVSRLKSAGGHTDAHSPPDAARLRAQAEAYLRSAYEPAGEPKARTLSADEAATVEVRLRDLGYL